MARREKAPEVSVVDGRRLLLERLDEMKRQNPELAEILRQFQIDQADYDQAMLQIMTAEWTPYSTYGTATA